MMNLNKKNVLLILICTIAFLSCNENEKLIEQTFSDEYLIKNVLFVPVANMESRAVYNSDNPDEQAEDGLVIARLGRKSQNCFGFGVCEWFPKDANQLNNNDVIAEVGESENSDELVVYLKIYDVKDNDIDLSLINMEINQDMILNIDEKQYKPTSDIAIFNPIVGEKGAYQLNHYGLEIHRLDCE